ncbi:MAG: hypothetical protein PUB75_00690 [Firmicutes bacterium]|nr:hypothetical protein [Bacillota bacterium]
MFDIFNRKKDELNVEVADQMLQNIFDVCEVEPNTVPLNDLQSYSNYRKDRFFLQKVILVIVMLLFLALPLFFFGPKISVLEQSSDSPHPTYHLGVDSIMPVTSVKATIDGKNVPVYEKQKKVYSIEPDTGGEMTVTVSCLNNQSTTETITVSAIDRDVPKVTSDSIRDNLVYLSLEDEGSGIAWDKIYIMKSDGSKYEPTEYNAEEGWVSLEYPNESVNIFIPDNADNVLQLALTIK